MIVQQLDRLTESQTEILNSIDALAKGVVPENGIPDNFKRVEKIVETMKDGTNEIRRYVGLQAGIVPGVHVPPRTELDFIRIYLTRLSDSAPTRGTDRFISVGNAHYCFDEKTYALYREVSNGTI